MSFKYPKAASLKEDFATEPLWLDGGSAKLGLPWNSNTEQSILPSDSSTSTVLRYTNRIFWMALGTMMVISFTYWTAHMRANYRPWLAFSWQPNIKRYIHQFSMTFSTTKKTTKSTKSIEMLSYNEKSISSKKQM